MIFLFLHNNRDSIHDTYMFNQFFLYLQAYLNISTEKRQIFMLNLSTIYLGSCE